MDWIVPSPISIGMLGCLAGCVIQEKSKLNPLRKAYWIAKGVGWDNILRRLYQSYSIRTGKLNRSQNPKLFRPELCPLYTTSTDDRLSQWKLRSRRFFPIPSWAELDQIVPQAIWYERVVSPISDALKGNYPMFSRWSSPLGWPPDFNHDATNKLDWPVGPIWTKTTKSGGDFDDIKLVWEPSRTTVLFHLARAYRYDGNEVYAESIWNCIESWIKQNPVNQSVAWGCGQEVAFRMMAILFSVFCVLDSPSTNANRLAQIDTLAWQSGRRIASNINYAISQENNHALSEALGLWTLGILFPEFPDSSSWLTQGKSILEKEINRQIYDDGAYVQHSMSYHRVMLDDMLWAIQLGDINDMALSSSTISRVKKAAQWLDEFVDDKTGRVPNLGANDGANVLPLSCSDYLDYRPVIVAASVLLDLPIRERDYSLALEKACWFKGRICHPRIHKRPANGDSWDSPVGGYAILRHSQGYALLKGGKYRDRPGQCDALHVDVWHRHDNILRDGGSFHYYHRDLGLKNLFYSVESHNTVQVNGQEQMEKGPNFLWFNWSTVLYRRVSSKEMDIKVHFHTASPYYHRRRVVRFNNGYAIDDLVDMVAEKETPAECICRWRLSPNLQWSVNDTEIVGFQNEQKICKLEFNSTSPIFVKLKEGWESLYYGERTKLPVVHVVWQGTKLQTRIEFFDECPGTQPS